MWLELGAYPLNKPVEYSASARVIEDLQRCAAPTLLMKRTQKEAEASQSPQQHGFGVVSSYHKRTTSALKWYRRCQTENSRLQPYPEILSVMQKQAETHAHLRMHIQVWQNISRRGTHTPFGKCPSCSNYVSSRNMYCKYSFDIMIVWGDVSSSPFLYCQQLQVAINKLKEPGRLTYQL